MADRVERVSEETTVYGGRVVKERAVNVSDRNEPINKVARFV